MKSQTWSFLAGGVVDYTAVSPPAIEGTRIGRYTNLTLLGQGGMGAVYRAYDPALDRTVALKVVLEKNPEFLARFQREAKAVARLSHPHIVQVYDFGQDADGNPFFVMELVIGKSLDGVVKERGPMAPAKVVELLRQAALGLAAAHAAGVIHRDIKPHNMLLDEGGQLKLVDFGIARVTGVNEGLTQNNEALGTLHYMAPEVLSGQPADARADIYSLGLVAFHLLTGKAPFSGPSAVAIAMKQISEPLPDLTKEAPATPVVLRRLIERMTHKERAERIQTCDEIARACAAIADEFGKTDAMPPILPPGRPRILLFAAVLGLASAAIIIGVFGGVFGGIRVWQKRAAATSRLTPVRSEVSAAAPNRANQVKTGVENPPSQVVAAAPHGPVRVAVMPLRNLSNLADLNDPGQGISEAITHALYDPELAPKLRLLERAQLESGAVAELKLNQEGMMDKEAAQQYGHMLGAELLVQGAFQRLGDSVRITARFSRVETGEILDTMLRTVSLDDFKNKFSFQDEIAAEVKKHLVDLLPRARK